MDEPTRTTAETTRTAKLVPTSYIVLRQTTHARTEPDGPTVAWRIENSNVPATSAEAAIRLACKTNSTPEGTYVAVPARSWKPVTVKAETQTVLRLEDAGA